MGRGHMGRGHMGFSDMGRSHMERSRVAAHDETEMGRAGHFCCCCFVVDFPL